MQHFFLDGILRKFKSIQPCFRFTNMVFIQTHLPSIIYAEARVTLTLLTSMSCSLFFRVVSIAKRQKFASRFFVLSHLSVMTITSFLMKTKQLPHFFPSALENPRFAVPGNFSQPLLRPEDPSSTYAYCFSIFAACHWPFPLHHSLSSPSIPFFSLLMISRHRSASLLRLSSSRFVAQKSLSQRAFHLVTSSNKISSARAAPSLCSTTPLRQYIPNNQLENKFYSTEKVPTKASERGKWYSSGVCHQDFC